MALEDAPGRKDDLDKLRYDLIPPEAMRGLAYVYTIGAKKYADRNWEQGIKYSRVVGALFRHLFLWLIGEEFDTDNGQRHIDSVVWNAVALSTYTARGMYKFDDLPGRQMLYNHENEQGTVGTNPVREHTHCSSTGYTVGHS
jgi:hypothetical protein